MNVTRKIHLTGFGRRECTACMVELDVDIERLIDQLGEKAFRNRTGKTRAMNGLITVKVRPCQHSGD